MTDLVELHRRNVDFPVEVYDWAPDATPPLVRAAELYAHRSCGLSKPFELIRHRTKTYALITLKSDPFGWDSRIVSRPHQGHMARETYCVSGYMKVDVMTLALPPGSVLIVDGTLLGDYSIDIGLCRYVYRQPPISGP